MAAAIHHATKNVRTRWEADLLLVVVDGVPLGDQVAPGPGRVPMRDPRVRKSDRCAGGEPSFH
jgi:hypothetical protein